MEKHGEIQIQLDGQILRVTAVGAFNLEGTRSAYQRIEVAATQIYQRPWAKLTDFRECMLGAPECLELIGFHNQWCLQHGCIGMALVVSNAFVRDLYKVQNPTDGLPIAVFTDPDTAHAHLLDLLATQQR